MLSFVVPAHNEEELLPLTLASIHEAAAGRAYEIIVVDDASTDRTAELARQAGARVVSVQHRQIAATRNAGAAQAQGEWLFFIDADTRIPTAYVDEAVELLQRGAGGGGARFDFDGQLPLYARLLTPLFDAIIMLFQLTGGCCLFCRRDLFATLGGFNLELYAGEELDLAYRLKRKAPFRIVRSRVLTSGRKLRNYTLGELLRVLWGLARKGTGALKDREGLDLWYQRRNA